jgi:uncharacterized membrane protein YcjF (UPF0283 family)
VKILGALGALLLVALIVPQTRGWLLEVWGRVQLGGNMAAVIAALVLVFVMGVVIASSDRP